MGLATLPSPSEGVLCVILVNTAVPFTIVGYLIRALLFILRVPLNSAFTSVEPSEEEDSSSSNTIPQSETYLGEFRSKTQAVRFDSVCKNKKEETEDQECAVCLTGFEPDSEINDLSCGHVFHKGCLEQWLDYWNITCPLCRTPLMATEEDNNCHAW